LKLFVHARNVLRERADADLGIKTCLLARSTDVLVEIIAPHCFERYSRCVQHVYWRRTALSKWEGRTCAISPLFWHQPACSTHHEVCAHAVTSSSEELAETCTSSGANRFNPSSAGLEPCFALALPPSASYLLGQPLAPPPSAGRPQKRFFVP